MASPATRTPQEITAEITSRLDVAAEFTSLGVKIHGRPRTSGMVSCYAWGRDDRKPSAWINVKSAMYGDSGGADAPAWTCSLFDLAVKAGRFVDWKEARKAYAEKVGVVIGKERKSKSAGETKTTDWHEKLEFQDWSTPGNDVLLLRWCKQFKPGVTPESVKAAGGQLAYYPCWVDRKTGEKHRTRDCHQVVAIPCYGPWLLDAEPVAWVIWDVCGREFDTTPRDTPPSEPRIMAKMLSIGPTSGAMMGLSSLMALSDPEQRDWIELAWKVEGPADMLALWAAVPEGDRAKVAILTAAGGATADVYPHQAKLFAGLPTAVVPDCDAAGVVGAEKWTRVLYGISQELRVVRLPWGVKPKHGEDVRDFLTGKPLNPHHENLNAPIVPRTYADLLTVYQSSPAWEPASSEPSTDAKSGLPDHPGQETLDFFADEQIADALKIDVLGQREDGTIEVYSEHLHRTVVFRCLSQIKYPDMLRLFGTPVRRAVSKTNEDAAPGMYPISDAREAIGHLASRRLLSDETKLGVGCWPIEDGSENPIAVILVNASEAMRYNGTIERVTHPRHGGHLLSFESGAKPWYDHDQLSHFLFHAADKEFRATVVNDLCELFKRWNWGHQIFHPLVTAGLVLATWVQSLWPWRPRIDVLGGTNTGKSMFCKALAGIYGDLVILTSDTTAAGLRQKICNSAAVVIVDEVDAKNRAKMARQREILEMLRSASRGTSVIRGTGSGKAMEFTLRHLVWVAGISVNYDDQADSNRAVRLDLLPPKSEMAGKLVVPPQAELADLGQRCLATALWCSIAARELAAGLKDQKVEGVDQRAIESLAVPVAMLATAKDWNGLTPSQLLQEVASGMRRESGGQMESDEQSLVQEILGASVRLGQYNLNVGQAIELVCKPGISNRDEWLDVLSASGIKLWLGVDAKIGLSYKLIRRKLLYGTQWHDQPIDQYIHRLDNRELKQIRCGGAKTRGAVFPLRWFRDQFIDVEEQQTILDEGF